MRVSDDYLWNPRATPDPDIARLESLLRPFAYRPDPLRTETIVPRPRRMPLRAWSIAAAAVLVLAVGTLYVTRRQMMRPWEVTARRGAPVVRGALGERSHHALAKGGVVETDAHSVAVVNVGHIGRAELGPRSRLRLLHDGQSEYRLALEQGTMHASVNAPPRYFLVETASALAVDLGCVYTLSVDERGAGFLAVEQGEVELQRGGVRSAVLAGNGAALRPGSGPGLPYPLKSSDAFRRAVSAYDADPASAAALGTLLAAVDERSTITLWHLLERADPRDRARVYERLAAIAPPPASVTRERVLRGESGALQRWRTDLQPTWIVQPPLWH
jgi:hypothetical protein